MERVQQEESTKGSQGIRGGASNSMKRTGSFRTENTTDIVRVNSPSLSFEGGLQNRERSESPNRDDAESYTQVRRLETLTSNQTTMETF